jgi:hypothetical protein
MIDRKLFSQSQIFHKTFVNIGGVLGHTRILKYFSCIGDFLNDFGGLGSD